MYIYIYIITFQHHHLLMFFVPIRTSWNWTCFQAAPGGVFAALAGVGEATQAVQGNGQGAVCLATGNPKWKRRVLGELQQFSMQKPRRNWGNLMEFDDSSANWKC